MLERAETMSISRRPVILRTRSLEFSPATPVDGALVAKGFIDAIWVTGTLKNPAICHGQLWAVVTARELNLDAFLASYDPRRFKEAEDRLARLDSFGLRARPHRPVRVARLRERLGGIHRSLLGTGTAQVPGGWTGWYHLHG